MRVEKKKRAGKTWCGPAALTYLAGCEYEEAEQALLKTSGRPMIKGVYNFEMEYAAADLGIPLRVLWWADLFERKSLATFRKNLWADSYRAKHGREPLLINLRSHYVVLHGMKVFDNMSPEGVSINDSGYKGSIVRGVWKVSMRATRK